MDESTTISVVALIFAIGSFCFGIVLQFLMYKATTEQMERVSNGVADSQSNIKGLVERLSGLTDKLLQVQDGQFRMILEAFVTRPSTAAEASERAAESALDFSRLSVKLEKSEGRSDGDISEIRRDIDSIREKINTVVRLTAEISKPLPRVVSQHMMQVWVEGLPDSPNSPEPFAVDVADLILQIGDMMKAGKAALRSEIAAQPPMVYSEFGMAIEAAKSKGLLIEQGTVTGVERGGEGSPALEPDMILTLSDRGLQIFEALRQAGYQRLRSSPS